MRASWQAATAVATILGLAHGAVAGGEPGLPRLLSGTGLFAPGSTISTAPGVIPYAPQYALWSDGARKRRWLYLPPGRAIDASRPDAWRFPRGTRLWKEFAHAGRVETRYIERGADGAWRYGTYVWNAQGTDAVLAPEGGIAALPVPSAPNGRYAIPSVDDCRACHEGAPVPVLGVGALQLSSDRDPLAPHADADHAPALDLRALAATGRLRGLPRALLARPPRIPAASPVERAALGYLHANCGHCHNHDGAPAPVRLRLAQSAATPHAGAERVRASLIDAPSRYRAPGRTAGSPLVAPGRPQDSVLLLRMRSRHPNVQMPPLGTQLPDPGGLALVERWIHHLPLTKETAP
jgi:hypothetical protein